MRGSMGEEKKIKVPRRLIEMEAGLSPSISRPPFHSLPSFPSFLPSYLPTHPVPSFLPFPHRRLSYYQAADLASKRKMTMGGRAGAGQGWDGGMMDRLVKKEDTTRKGTEDLLVRHTSSLLHHPPTLALASFDAWLSSTRHAVWVANPM